MTLVAFIFVLGILIFVHELGHFLAAKSVGIGVHRFSIGFGPPTPLRFQWGETEYQVAWIPLGGYVKMASREEQEAMAGLEGEEFQEFPPEKLFENKPLAARILAISAGVIMNALFAWVVYAGLAYSEGRAEDATTTLSRVEAAALPAGAEALAELPAGTRILGVDGEPVETWTAIERALLGGGGERLLLEVEDGAGPRTVEVPVAGDAAREAVARAMVRRWEARVGGLIPDRPAADAGLELNDLIVAIDGEPIVDWDGLVQHIEASAGRALLLAIDREGGEVEVSVTPAEETVPDSLTGEKRQVGRVGIVPALQTVTVELGALESVAEGGRRTWGMAAYVLGSLKNMVLGRVSMKELGGPIVIAQVSGEAARAGFSVLLSWTALLSVNLAILNLLPIPVLDGGHLVFLFLEGVRRRPLPVVWRHRLTTVGLYFILALMLFVVGNDLFRVFG